MFPPTLERMLSWPSISSWSLSFCSPLLSKCDLGSSPQVFGAAEPHGKNAQQLATTMHNLYMLWGSQSAEKRNYFAGRHSLSPISLAAEKNVIASFSLKTREVHPEVSSDGEIKLYSAMSSFSLSQWTRADLGCRESAQPVREQPASALTGGGSDQTGKEEFLLLQTTIQTWCAAQ